MTITSPKDRIKEERKRLKLTQAVIAELFGIQRETWSRYESGVISPGMDVLIAFSKLGADIQYILTGEKQLGLILTKEEKELLDLYRNAPITIKAAALGALTAGTAQKNSKQTIGSVSGGQVSAENINNYNFGFKRKRG